MRVNFLISAAAFLRLGFAAGERGWRSDPDYAERIVQRTVAEGGEVSMLANLAAMCADFELADPIEVVRAIGSFFGEKPASIEIGGQDFRVGATLVELRRAA
jgi:hypothetical protein